MKNKILSNYWIFCELIDFFLLLFSIEISIYIFIKYYIFFKKNIKKFDNMNNYIIRDLPYKLIYKVNLNDL